MDIEAILGVVIIIISIIVSANKGKKIKQNAPGQSSAPIQQTPQPVSPTASSNEQGTFWQQMGSSLTTAPSARPAVERGHQAVTSIKEGDSRECEHGSLGGSMAYGNHSEGTMQKIQKKNTVLPAQAESVQHPSISAEEMRRAVIMAEILKRPQERMMEQSRRWGAQ